MSEQIKLMRQFVSEKSLNEIDQWIAKYPADQKQSAVLSALMIVQKEQGYLTPPMMDAVALYLDMAKIDVYEVVNFYTMYEQEPTGRHVIHVCTNVPCQLRGASQIMAHLESKLNIQVGETTPDKRFTLRSVECLGACVHAPMMQIGLDYHEHLTPETVNAVLEQYE